MRALFFGLMLAVACAASASAQAACPNQQTTIAIPYPTGSADVIIVDQTTCNPLVAADMRVYAGNGTAYPVLGTATKPAVSVDPVVPTLLHLSANGTPFGTVQALLFYHVPSAKSYQMTAFIGTVIQGVVGTTTTPAQ